MPALLIYLVKVNVALLVFCLGYYAVLWHLTFYTLNRAYLVTAILFSTLYPLINVTAFVNRHQEIARPIQVVVVNWQAPANTLVQSVSHHDKWYWLQMAFWIGVVILAIRLFMQLLSLYRLHRASEPAQLKHYHIRVTKGDVNPFSFWRSIYVNPANHAPNELDAILAHEQIHVNEWHTLDILLGEISTVFYWFNPGIWLMKKAIRENIEFITDRKILQQGMDCKTYQYSLVNVSFETRHNAIVNHFNISTIKKRIMMMNAKRSSNVNLGRYVFLIPAVIALLLVFSVSKAELHKAASSSKHLLTNIKTAVAKIDLPFKSAKPESVLIHAKDTKTDTTKKYFILHKENSLTTTDSAKELSNSITNLHVKKFSLNNKLYFTIVLPNDTIRANKKNALNIKSGNLLTSTQFNKQKFTRLETQFRNDSLIITPIDENGVAGKPNISVIKPASAADIHKLIYSNGDTDLTRVAEKYNLDLFNKATKIRLNGKTPGKGKIDSLLHNMQGFKVDKDGNVTQNGVSVKGKFFAYSIDSSLHDMQGLKVDKDGTVIKGGRVILGGKSPVQGTVTIPNVLNIVTAPVNFNNKLIIIDGKEATPKELKKLSIDKIATIRPIYPPYFNQNQDSVVLSKYGDKAKKGVVIITTKK